MPLNKVIVKSIMVYTYFDILFISSKESGRFLCIKIEIQLDTFLSEKSDRIA